MGATGAVMAMNGAGEGGEMNNAQTTLRMPLALWQQIKDEYASTYPQHRLSLNKWLVKRIAPDTPPS